MEKDNVHKFTFFRQSIKRYLSGSYLHFALCKRLDRTMFDRHLTSVITPQVGEVFFAFKVSRILFLPCVFGMRSKKAHRLKVACFGYHCEKKYLLANHTERSNCLKLSSTFTTVLLIDCSPTSKINSPYE